MADEANDVESRPGGTTADPATVFAALAEIIYQGSDPSEVYAAICVAATLVVSGCDHASLLVRRDGRYVTVGASDQHRAARRRHGTSAPATDPASMPSKTRRRKSNPT